MILFKAIDTVLYKNTVVCTITSIIDSASYAYKEKHGSYHLFILESINSNKIFYSDIYNIEPLTKAGKLLYENY